MAKTDHYFQFPLALLAYGPTPTDRLNAIVNFASRYAGRVKLAELQRLGQPFVPQRQVAGYNPEKRLHQELLAGADWMGVQYRNLAGMISSCEEMDRFLGDFALQHGPSPYVRLRLAFLFEARDRKGMSYPELSVLAAIYSVIGNKRAPVRITQATIQARALGYKSPKMLQALLPSRTDQAQPLTSWEVRKLVARLHSRKLFARSTYARRLTYYSNRMTQAELGDAVIERKTNAGTFNFIRRQRDETMTETIRARLGQG